MNGRIDLGTSRGTVGLDQSQGVHTSRGTQTKETDSRIRDTLGTDPRTPSLVKQSSTQTLTSPKLSSLRGQTSQGVRTDPQRTFQAQIRARGGLPRHLEVTVPPSSRKVSLDSRILAKEIQGLPKGQRAGAMARAGQTLQERITKGFDTYQKILDGKAETPAKLSDIRDFMTFLTAKAGQKTSYFEEGAFNLPDPGNKIRKFLDSCTDVYQRNSTHIDGFADHKGCGHRGIDMGLPNGMGTLLYGGMNDGVMGTRGDRIFLKMESHGCRISTLKQSKRDTEGPGDRGKRWSDLFTSIKHGIGGIKTLLGLQKTEGTRKERLDKGVEKEFKALVKMAQESGVEGLSDMLNKNDPAGPRTGHGIRTMLENINTILEHTEEGRDVGDGFFEISLDDKKTLDLPKEIRTELEAFKGRLEQRYDHVEHRIGNEMIFDADELFDTGQVKEKFRNGQVMGLVSDLLDVKDPEKLTTENLKGMLTAFHHLKSNIDGGTDTEKTRQKTDAFHKGISGLNPGQNAQLREILSSPKFQDLINEFMDKQVGGNLELPVEDLSTEQESHVRQMMQDSIESMMLLCEMTGAELRQDGRYSQSQMKEVSPMMLHLTGNQTE